MSERTYFALLALITAVAWGIRLVLVAGFIGLHTPLDRADGLDEIDYEQFAHQLSIGRGFVLPDGEPSARRAPGTSLIIAPFYLMFGRSLALARVWMTLVSALICPAAAWVIRGYCGSRTALLAALLCAIDPGLFYYAMHLWSEAPYALVLVLGTGCLMRAMERGGFGLSVAAGCCWGAATLLRPQFLLAFPCALPALWFLQKAERRRGLREFFRQAMIVAVILAPWLLRNHLVIGAPTMTTLVSGHTFWGAHNEVTFHDPRYRGTWRPYLQDPAMIHPLTGSELEQDQQAWENGWRCVRRNIEWVPRLIVAKLYRLVTPFEDTANRFVYWSFAIFWILTAPLAVVGLCRMRCLSPRLWGWILIQLAALVLCSMFFYGAARFRHTLEPFFMLAVAVALTNIPARLADDQNHSASGNIV